MSDAQTKRVQEIVGTFLFAAWAVDPNEKTMDDVNYSTMLPLIQFKHSGMQLEIATDSSYLSETNLAVVLVGITTFKLHGSIVDH